MKILVLACFLSSSCFSQTLGGRTVYNFIKLPASPIIAAAGGSNVSYRTNEVSVSSANPALLQPDLSTQINASFNTFLAGIKTYSLSGALQNKKLNATLGGHIYYVDYGNIPATDAAGNLSGEFRPRDFVAQISAAKKYLERWMYGATIKFISSSYASYSSSAIAVDVGVLYFDSSRNLTASFVAKNMGAQIKTYAGQNEDLPFDLQAGITKRLAKAPFAFSFTANHLHRFDISYNDTLFNSANGFTSPSSIQSLFNHFVLATHIYLGQNLEATIGYNHLRRQEFSTPDAANGLAGFSAGLRVKFSKIQILYARSTYQKGISYNQIGITADMNKLVGL